MIRRLIAGAAALLVVASSATACTGGSAAQKAAASYANLIAAGDAHAVEALTRMTFAEDPGAIRSAGLLLRTASERITVTEVGDARRDDDVDLPYGTGLEDPRRVTVHYRLHGSERTGVIGLARMRGAPAGDTASWKVVEPLMATGGWRSRGFASLEPDLYLGGQRVARRDDKTVGDTGDAQPLYAAVYALQYRLDPYFTSKPAQLVVGGSQPAAPPEPAFQATATTRRLITSQFIAGFGACPDPADDCRFANLATAALTGRDRDVSSLGLSRKPRLDFDGFNFTITGGRWRYRDRSGTHEVSFGGTGRYVIDSTKLRPAVLWTEVALQAVP